jgi:hypothetical protein
MIQSVRRRVGVELRRGASDEASRVEGVYLASVWHHDALTGNWSCQSASSAAIHLADQDDAMRPDRWTRIGLIDDIWPLCTSFTALTPRSRSTDTGRDAAHAGRFCPSTASQQLVH